jgi:hypothetical protein
MLAESYEIVNGCGLTVRVTGQSQEGKVRTFANSSDKQAGGERLRVTMG